jgi:AraC-like DNA-binding protein
LSNHHPRPWHRHSEFGDGLRWPLDREQRCVWRVRLDLARRAGRISSLHVLIGLALLHRLGQDGRLDPSHDTLAADVGCTSRTVRRALAALFELGMVRWINRLVRNGRRAEQTSNAYTLIVAAVAAFAPRPRRATRCATSGGQTVPETRSDLIVSLERGTASAALARIAEAWEEKARRMWATRFA